MKSGVNITKEKQGKHLLIHLEGKLDALSSPTLEMELKHEFDEGEAQFILDFSKIEYLSSAGLRVLIANTKKAKTGGGFLHIYGMGEDVFEIVKMAGFDRVLQIFKSEQEALKED